ncbi:hypothetical protein Pyn_24444 [Prunus yedoensis var. nudiflora]|uniref:Uncharacterized protein n=1 Tax=Prunus yedoensis var. nudiflora TaxID=2094558 RepID=A0A315A4M1_PRUYE|nr:hypothetical protein Pyn_24444 [Prunus yedoensis var. nudiflora]
MRLEIIDEGEELDVVAPRCFCGKIARLQTSWTEANPLRRFHREGYGDLAKGYRCRVTSLLRCLQDFKPTHSALPL